MANQALHESWTNSSTIPVVFKEEDKFNTTLSVDVQPVMDAAPMINVSIDEKPKKLLTLPTTASCRSDCIPLMNKKPFDENDDDPTGPLFLQLNDQPGSLVARLELALLLSKTTATTCHDAYCNTISQQVIY